jgi:hypothetical protein
MNLLSTSHGDEHLSLYEWQYNDEIYRSSVEVWHCEIIERLDIANSADSDMKTRKDSIRPMDVRYTALIRRDVEGEPDPIYVTNLPRRAIQFLDAEYVSDQYLPNSFRHEMHLPDNMIPPAWRDNHNYFEEIEIESHSFL